MMNKWFLSVLCLFFLCFGPGVCNWFGGDDFLHLAWAGEPVRDIIVASFSGDFYRSLVDYNYRPLPNSIFAILTSGLNPAPLRIFLILLHLSNATLLVKCIQKINTEVPSWLVFSIFAFHPAVITNVNWLSSLSDCMATSGALLCFYLYNSKRFFSASLAFIGALFCKEIVFSLPLLLLAVSFWQRQIRKEKLFLIALFTALAGFILLRTALLGTILAGDHSGYYFTFGAGTAISVGQCLLSLVLPIPIKFLFDYPALLLAVLYSAFLVFVIIKSFRSPLRSLVFLSGVFLVTLLPVLNSYGSWYLYYPLAALLITFFAMESRQFNWLYLMPFLLLSLVSHAVYTQYYRKAGEYARDFVQNIASVEPNEIVILSSPIALYRIVPVFQGAKHIEMAAKLFEKKEIKVQLLSRAVFNNGPGDAAYKLQSDGITISLTGHRDYFYVTEGDQSVRSRSFLGNPVSLSIPTTWSSSDAIFGIDGEQLQFTSGQLKSNTQ